ncbi:MAG: MarR family winged helix-turn-helix transcriptional regulator [Flavobacteriales bacterium]
MDSKIIATLERLSQAFRVLLWQESKEFSLSPIQVQLLIFILHHSEEKCRVSYLADEFNMTKATISDSVKALIQKDLVKKEFQQHDTRSYLIHLTTKGQKVADKASRFTTEIRKPIESMDESNKENLLKSLLDTVLHLNQTGIITIQRMCQTCRFYQKDSEGQDHFCALLHRPLHIADHRIDCPEHELIG